MNVRMIWTPSPNFSIRTLPISTLVLHYTGMKSGAEDRRHGMEGRPGSASMAAISLFVIAAWMSRRSVRSLVVADISVSFVGWTRPAMRADSMPNGGDGDYAARGTEPSGEAARRSRKPRASSLEATAPGARSAS